MPAKGGIQRGWKKANANSARVTGFRLKAGMTGPSDSSINSRAKDYQPNANAPTRPELQREGWLSPDPALVRTM